MLVSLMESSILSEVEDTSILKTGLSTCWLLPPRSGLERSDFVLWHKCEVSTGSALGGETPELARMTPQRSLSAIT